MGDAAGAPELGCARCWPPEPAAAWEAHRALTRATELVDESHFHVALLVCPRCAQRFVWVFTEEIDWADGEDPQSCSMLPITQAEADGLVRDGASVTEARLSALGPGRRCLQHEYPKRAPPRTTWGSGLFVGPHD